MTGSPYPILEAMEDVRLIWTDDDAVLRGAEARWFPGSRRIAVDSRLRRLIARCALAHELAHVVLGHPCSSGDEFYDNRLELDTDRLAARWLIDDLDELGTEIATTTTHGHAAANLRVTMDIFDARLNGLTAEEERRLKRSVWAVHEGGGV